MGKDGDKIRKGGGNRVKISTELVSLKWNFAWSYDQTTNEKAERQYVEYQPNKRPPVKNALLEKLHASPFCPRPKRDLRLHVFIKHENRVLLSLKLLHVWQREVHFTEPSRLTSLKRFFLHDFFLRLLLLLGNLCLCLKLLYKVFVCVARSVDVISLWFSVLTES